MESRKKLEWTSRTGKLARSLFAALLLALAVPCFARPGPPQAAHPRFENNQQQHLGTWLQRHGSLPPERQEKALQNEPGFKSLAPETQQKLLDRLPGRSTVCLPINASVRLTASRPWNA